VVEHCNVGESNPWAKIQAFFNAQLHVTATVFKITSLVDCLALWNEFKVNDALDIEESDERCICDFDRRVLILNRL
jgi:hypothetical protein